VVKKRTARKPARKKAAKSPTASKGDQSRLDLKPLHRHIRKRIKELEGKRGAAPVAAVAAAAESEPDDTIERLKNVLETLEDICHPTMAIPI
jgi:hypothetical protein